MIQLRPYQDKGVRDILASFNAGNRSVLFSLPTGGGKTVLFSHIASRISARGKRVLIMAHRVELVEQIARSLESFGVYAGIQNPNYSPDYSCSVQVGSIQTVVSRVHLNRVPDYIILDEAHHATANTWRQVLAAFPNARVLGVTATPCRGDGVGLGRHVGGIFDDLVLGPSAQELTDMRFLVPARIIYPGEGMRADLSDVDKVGGEYVRGQLAAKVDNKMIIGDAIAHYQKFLGRDGGLRCVPFCVNVAHAEHVAELYREAGIRAASIDGSMDKNERRRRVADFGTGQIQVLTSCDLIGEGFDIPSIEGVQMLRPILSLGLYLQQIGRGLRTAKGKTECIVLDHVANVVKHYSPTYPHVWTLDGETKQSKKMKQEEAEKMRTCERCWLPFEPAPVCPFCGHTKAIKEIKTKAGVLVEWDAATMEKERKKQAKEAIEKAKARKADAVRDLLTVARDGMEREKMVLEMAAAAKSGGDLAAIGRAWDLSGKDLSSFVFKWSRKNGIKL